MSENAILHQRPHGVTDLFHEQAAVLTHCEHALERTFLGWGYQRIIVPTFEYYDTLATGASAQLCEEMYRFFDREGHELALRTDMTVSTARVVATRLYDQTLPLRFWYLGRVFRHTEPQAGQLREFTQAGIELIGADTAEADAEAVAVAIAALQALGLTAFQINLGQVAYLRAIVGEIGLGNGALQALEGAISRKNDLEIQERLDEFGVRGPVAQAVGAIPHLCGGPEVLAQAERLATNVAARAAVLRLGRVYDLLAREGVAEHVILDLGETRSMNYYTGITFHGYAAGLGFHVCSGGRYDGLIAQFGASLPAVGFALGLERALLAAQARAEIAPDLLMAASDDPAGRALAQRVRALGWRVECDVLPRSAAEFQALGRARRARRLLARQSDGSWLLVEGGVSRMVAPEALESEVSSWSH